jgi:Protein kinase domain
MVALKELGSFQLRSRGMSERFRRESRIAGSLNHPNIATVFEYFEHEGVPYIAMEYLARGSLRPYVGRLSLAQFAGVMEGVLAGLAHAEALGIVHRDLKPENLLVTDEGRVKITDFGIAKVTQAREVGAFLTTTGTTFGTPTYMAPEQAMAQEIGPWTDLYSVGVMAWEHMVGHVPFHDADAPMVVLMRHVNDVIAPATELRPDTDPEVSDWIERLLIKTPSERTRSPADAWEHLEEIIIRRLGPRWRRDARLPTAGQFFDAEAAGSAAPSSATTLPPRPIHALQTLPPNGAAAEPSAVTASDEPAIRRAVTRRPAVGLTTLAALAGAAAFLGTSTMGGAPHAGAKPRIVASNPFEISVPPDWGHLAATSLPHLALAEELVVGPRRPADGRLAIGLARSSDRTLLPADLLAALPGTPTSSVVALGHSQAYRYSSLTPAGAGAPETVYALSTTKGAVIAVCSSSAQNASFTAACERVIASLRLGSGQIVGLGPSPTYGSRLRAAVRSLNATTHAAQAKLSRARTPGDQAKAARLLAAAYVQAGRRLAAIDPAPTAATANAGVARALRSVADHYTALGRAAAAGDQRAYEGVRQAVDRADRTLATAFGELAKLGYEPRADRP